MGSSKERLTRTIKVDKELYHLFELEIYNTYKKQKMTSSVLNFLMLTYLEKHGKNYKVDGWRDLELVQRTEQ